MMNKIQFKLHRKFFGDKTIDSGVLDFLYNKYSDYCERLKVEPSFSEIDYKSICSTVYSVLSLRVNDSDFLFIFNRFTLFMIKDQVDGECVDINWVINHVNYLSLGTVDTTIRNSKYRQSLMIVKDCLKDRFDIKNEKKLRK